VALVTSAMSTLAGNTIELTGCVYDNLTHVPLQGALVKLLDANGNVVDSTKTNGVMIMGCECRDLSQFSFTVPREKGSKYTIEADYEGYNIGYLQVSLVDLGRRDIERKLPAIYLKCAKMLKEVTVTTTKVKFYNKNDTLVYNADAFQLAEGSMLDALVEQLPGVELKDEGQI